MKMMLNLLVYFTNAENLQENWPKEKLRNDYASPVVEWTWENGAVLLSYESILKLFSSTSVNSSAFRA